MRVIKWNSPEKPTVSRFCAIQGVTISSQDTIFGTHLESDESSTTQITIYVLIVHIIVILTSTSSSPNFLYSLQVFQIIMLPAHFFFSSPLLHVRPNLILITLILYDEENNL